MRTVILVTIALALSLLIVGCGGKDISLNPIVKGGTRDVRGVVLSQEQILEPNEPSPMSGVFVSGEWVEDAIDDIIGE